MCCGLNLQSGPFLWVVIALSVELEFLLDFPRVSLVVPAGD